MDFFKNEMIASNKAVGKYGVKFLDDYLMGIKQSDFIMIGAPTGTGKSNLAYQIAFDNAINLNVHLFALEADKDEPYRRRLYSEYSRWLKQATGKYEDYRDFVLGKFSDGVMVEQIEAEIVERYHKLEIHYRDREFTLETLHDKLVEINDFGKCEMIILDHVDYFDILSDTNENYQVSEIMKLLRDINLTWGIPVILISHLRKKSNRKVKVPEIEDIYGTSNKQKQMKTVILLAPDYENSTPEDGLFSTFFCIPKDRMFGGTHLIGACAFNSNIGAYEDRYKLCTSKDYGETILPYDGRCPKWAKSAKW